MRFHISSAIVVSLILISVCSINGSQGKKGRESAKPFLDENKKKMMIWHFLSCVVLLQSIFDVDKSKNEMARVCVSARACVCVCKCVCVVKEST